MTLEKKINQMKKTSFSFSSVYVTMRHLVTLLRPHPHISSTRKNHFREREGALLILMSLLSCQCWEVITTQSRKPHKFSSSLRGLVFKMEIVAEWTA